MALKVPRWAAVTTQETVDVLKATIEITYVEHLYPNPECNFERYVKEAIEELRTDWIEHRTRISPLFPGYAFVRIEQLRRDIRLLRGVIRPMMSGDAPAHVPDVIIAEIRSRELSGFVELPKKRLKSGDRVQIISSLLAGRRGRYAGHRTDTSRCRCRCSESSGGANEL
jgi:transcription antitermination factor NusG